MFEITICRAAVTAINQVAQIMGIETIAEWVEGETTLEMPRELGVDDHQGCWQHRPEELHEPARGFEPEGERG